MIKGLCECQDCGKKFVVKRGEKIKCPKCGSRKIKTGITHGETPSEYKK